MKTREEFMDAVAEALTDRIPNWAQRKGWYRMVGHACDIHPRTVEAHVTGENECTGTALANYITFFGKDFSVAILGRDNGDNGDVLDQIGDLIAHSRGKIK